MSADPRVELVLLVGAERMVLALVPEHALSAPPPSPGLAPGEGLAYAFPDARRVRFWTSGFARPIDQVFIAPSGRVVQLLEARAPGDQTLIGPSTPVTLVLELAAGEARRRGLLPGAKVVEAGAAWLFGADADPGFIAIVQSDRAGWFLACELRRRGFRIIHVHHRHHLAEVGEDEFDVALVYDDDLDEVVPALVALGPCYVLAGSELGVNAADYLAEELGLSGNGTLLSVARRHKAGMVEALAAAGIPVMRQVRARGWRRVARWMDRHRLPEIIIKPVRSAGSDRVALATDATGVRRALRAIIGATNRLGLAETEVVAQERLVGPEIYVNSVSRAGRHAVTEIWRETKRPARSGDAPFVYDTFQLLPGDDVLAGYLTGWLGRVLDALGVAWGPAHTELILTADGPRLIDFGARLDGVLLPALNQECIGRSPVELTADAYLDPTAWEAWAATPYRLRKHATMVVVDNPRAGILRDDSGLRALTRLPTFHALRPRWDPGEHVPATRDAFSYHAIVTLRDADPAAVEADYQHIRALEAADLLLDVTAADVDAEHPDFKWEISPVSDPRALAAWGEALAGFGWSTVSDPPSGLLAHRRSDRDGELLWVPRQDLPLDARALERLRLATGARRVIVELHPGARVVPLAGGDIYLKEWSAGTEAALAAIGLTPTMHEQAPPILELAPRAACSAYADITVTPLAALTPGDVMAAFAALGSGASWPGALAASLSDAAALAVTRGGAALGILHGGHVHVPVVCAKRRADLTRLAQALGAHFDAAVVAPGTGIAALPGGRRLRLPPALRWQRPVWAAHLADLDAIDAATGVTAAPSDHVRPAVAARFEQRQQPLATWGGAAIAQALGLIPVQARGAMLWLTSGGDAPHALAPHARRIDLAALHEVARAHRLAWIAWEPPPGTSVVIAADGSEHDLRWEDRGHALYEAARLGLMPVRWRWTHRKTFVLDLAGDERDVLARLEARRRTLLRAAIRDEPRAHLRIRVVPVSELGKSDWRRMAAVDQAFIAARPAPDELGDSAMPDPRHAARGLALGFGAQAVCALAEDADGLVSYIMCLLHDGVAWSILGTTHPRAARRSPQLLMRWHLIRHARARGCDLMDLFGGWDARFPDEHPSWRGFSRHKELLHACPIDYPPTLALFYG